jgi:demethylmenaquinone methyltransferase/2-methoxy-6-polyprenyl-1,4-benzoquinol methylase
MLSEKNVWAGKSNGLIQQNDPITPHKRVYFGYQQVSANEKPELVLRHFNSVANKYDLMNTILSLGIHYLWKRTAVKMMGLKAGDWVIDVCGGTGDLAYLAARAVGPTGRVILYDINWAMIEAGRKKPIFAPFGDRIQYIQGDAESISCPDESFEAAMVGFGIRNLTYMDKGLQEMYRVLKPGGKMMCLEFSKPTAPWFRWLYDFYSFHIMPCVGEIVAGRRQAYTHLPESIRTFASSDALISAVEKAGFSHVSRHKLTNGIAVVHLAGKE